MNVDAALSCNSLLSRLAEYHARHGHHELASILQRTCIENELRLAKARPDKAQRGKAGAVPVRDDARQQERAAPVPGSSPAGESREDHASGAPAILPVRG